tara:strand:- start:743 stop:1972 length:1230 start_codon:yes stop_codon:yes gene_type:complete
MQDFKGYLTEDRNTHLEHLEDEIINNGTSGAKTAINFLKSIKKMLQGGSGGSNVSVKWDGAPAVFCGINPENGKFFVATKSLFNVTPKINYTNADISRNHGGALADKLKTALKYLPSLGIKGILQGDLLFTDDKRRGKIGGEDSIIFTPNTITYAVPVAGGGWFSKSLSDKIIKAKIGIIFHTTYTGKTIKGLRATFGANVNSLRQNKNVFFDDASYKQVAGAGFTADEEKRFNGLIAMAEGSAYKAGKFVDKLKKDKGPLSLGVQMKTFFNTYIREGTPISNASALSNNFEVYFRDRLKKEIDSKKTQAAKQKYKEILEVGMKILRPNRDGLYFTIATYITLQTTKKFLLDKLNSIQQIGSFLRTKDGYKVTNPEGYVAIRRGGAVKLVDRLTFSRANFNMAKDWVKG